MSLWNHGTPDTPHHSFCYINDIYKSSQILSFIPFADDTTDILFKKN